MKKQVVILGINGGFGALFSGQLFKDEDITIVGVDLGDTIHQDSHCSSYISSDVSLLNEQLKSVISTSDIIIICLPEYVAYSFLDSYRSFISKTSLLIDTLSVKAKVVSIYVENNFNALSLNPMFGPDLPMAGKNIIVVRFGDAQAAEWFIALLEEWMLRIVYTTSEEHDRISSYLQVATHAAIMAFGITLNNAEIPVTELLKVATPPFLNMTALFGRITSGKKNVYWNIQRENEYASAMRKTLINNLVALDKCIDEGNEESFNSLIGIKTPEQNEVFQTLSNHFLSQINIEITDL